MKRPTADDLSDEEIVRYIAGVDIRPELRGPLERNIFKALARRVVELERRLAEIEAERVDPSDRA